LVFWGIWGGVQMFIPGLQMCTNEITIVGIFFFLNFEYGGANVTDLPKCFFFLVFPINVGTEYSNTNKIKLIK
jgi:hypothetical protein